MTFRFLDLFRTRAAEKPLSAETAEMLLQAQALQREGQLASAATIYRSVLEIHPTHWQSMNAIAAIALQRGELENAVRLYDIVIERNDGHAEAYYKRANALNGLGRLEPALADYDRAIALDPEYANAHCNRGAVLQRLARWDDALAGNNRALALNPDDSLAHFNKGSVLRTLRRFEEALDSYDQAVALKSDYVEAHFYRGDVLRELQRYEAAVASYDRAIELTPDGTLPYVAYSSRGFALVELKRLDEALTSFEQAIALKSDYVEAYIDRGNTLQELQRYEAAIASYNEAITLDPQHFLAYCNRGSVLKKLHREDEALASYEQAITLKGDSVEAHINRGNVLLELRRYEEAVASYDKAIAHHAVDVLAYAAHSGRGIALRQLRRFEDAIASYEQAIKLKEDDVEAYMNRGGLLQEVQRHEAAIGSYGKAIELKPDYAEAYQGRGFSLLCLRQHEAAIASFDQALALKPDQKYLLGFRRYVQMQICDWDGLAPYLQRFEEALKAHSPVSAPFQVLALLDSAPLQRLAAEIWVREECPPDDKLGAIPARPRGDKVRVGYFSADFRNHAVSLLTAELFETHDRSRFETIAFAFGPKTNDAVRGRLERAFDRFIDVSDQSDSEVASMARRLGIDIAVDLGGFTEHSRTNIFALRAAPVQLSYIGYLGTMGAPYMDYLVADTTIIPAEEQQHYSEKILYLPSYQVNDSQRRASERTFTREELGLPASGFVFACFNNNYKIAPPTFALWMRILKRVENSCLFLYANNHLAQRNLLKEVERCGVDPNRIVFGQTLVLGDYLARFRTMDLFLDTLPYNAGTTASDALWTGLPVLTCAGRAFAGRVAASLLKALDLPELITATASQYEDLAVHLAMNPVEMAQIRQKLARNRLVKPLFDTAGFTRNLEYAYTHIYERYHANLPPEHVYPQSR